MEVRHILSEQEKEWLVSRQWYHQRFDGCLLIFSYIVEAHARKEPRKENQEIDGSISTVKEQVLLHGQANIMLNFFFDGKTDYYIDIADNEQITKFFLEKSETNPNFTKEFMKRWAEDEKDFVEVCNQIDNTKLNELSNEQLISLHQEFGEKYTRRVTSSSVIDGFALGSDHIIAQKIHSHLKKIGKEKDYNFIFSILTAPVYISFTNEAEVSLLRIAQKIEKSAELKQLFLQHSEEEIMDALNEHKEIYDRLVAHQKNFYWLHNNYVDAHILPIEYFVYEIKKLLEEGHDITNDVAFILSHSKENKEKKDKLIEELQLPSDVVALLRYSEDFTHWQDERKKATFFATHYFTVLLDEMARRTGFTLMELKYLLPHEIRYIFDGKITRKELQKRMEGCMTAVRPESLTFIVGEEAAQLYEAVKRLDIPKDLKVIKGLPASLGKVVGIAKIVKSAKEIAKVNPGDILVAVMTRPDYVIGMKKAAAIVTDEGGLTCHAAIISREFRLPCVIATKFATHVLCDGDKIEVDADKGEVRILKRAIAIHKSNTDREI